MAEQTKPTRRRHRRSTATSLMLEAARERRLTQLAEQREKEERVDTALTDFYAAGERIAEIEQDARRKLEPLERAMAEVAQRRERLVEEQRTAQGLAALAIHENDVTVMEVGQLLGVAEKPARQLIAIGRHAAAAVSGGPSPETATEHQLADDHDGGPGHQNEGQAPTAPPPAVSA
ncbi:hypothetical protein AB0A63_13875 [Lentzea sp. NPDC042327]|uniref:hypothetical protein n=1 Tax=Lentzea sp. NPDC042327 TaxID=3154801 RepID=UPI0033C1F3C7